MTDADRPIASRLQYELEVPDPLPLELFDATDQAAMKQFGDLRTEFVARMGWKSGGEYDQDAFDAVGACTRYAIKRDTVNDRVIVGLRLTPIQSPTEALSYQMVQTSPVVCAALRDHPNVSELEAAAQQGNLWDLTRLVHSDSHQYRPLILGSMVEVIVAGIVATTEGDREPIWMFATTPHMLRVFEAIGVVYTILAADTVNGDTDETYLGFVRPLECLNHVRSQPVRYRRTLVSVQRAFELLDQTGEAEAYALY